MLRRGACLAILALLAAVPHARVITPSEPLTAKSDLDGLMKLSGIAEDPSLRAALGWFVGDDPQGVHTFRPLAALSLWAEYRLWGFTRWPYQVLNLVYLILIAVAIAVLAQTLGLPPRAALAVMLLFLVRPTWGSSAVVSLIGTRHDLLCTLFALLACIALVRYLSEGGRRTLAAYAAFSLLAYLAKEMALALLLLALSAAILEVRAGVPRRRALAAVGVSLAVALLWFAWYRLAEANMGPVPHGSHSFGGMAALLAKRWRNSLILYADSLAPPLVAIARQVYLIRSPEILLYWLFWPELARLVLFVVGLILLWRHRRRWLVAVYLWKVFTYLPVLPLNRTWPWYEFMPHVLDPILVVGAIWCLWCPAGAREAARRWLAAARERRAAARAA